MRLCRFNRSVLPCKRGVSFEFHLATMTRRMGLGGVPQAALFQIGTLTSAVVHDRSAVPATIIRYPLCTHTHRVHMFDPLGDTLWMPSSLLHHFYILCRSCYLSSLFLRKALGSTEMAFRWALPTMRRNCEAFWRLATQPGKNGLSGGDSGIATFTVYTFTIQITITNYSIPPKNIKSSLKYSEVSIKGSSFT